VLASARADRAGHRVTGSGAGFAAAAEPAAPADDGWLVDQLPGDHPVVLALGPPAVLTHQK